MSSFIRGIGLTKVKEAWSKGIDDLAIQATRRAINDADIKKEEIDKIYVSSALADSLENQRNLGAKILDMFGLSGKPVINVSNGGCSGGIAVHLASQEIQSGLENILVIGVEKMKDSLWSELLHANIKEESWNYLGRMGATNIGLEAMLMRLYVSKFDAEHENIAKIVEISHQNACSSSHAQFPFPLSVENILKSPTSASPLKLFESAGTGDGAAATVVSGSRSGVKLLASEVSTDKFLPFERENPLTLEGVNRAANRAYRVANILPSDIDFAELYDRSSILGLLEIEALNFANRGEGHEKLKKGKFNLNEDISINTFGGLKARGNPVGATGVYQIIEATKQLRENAEGNQVENANVGLTLGLSGLGSHVVVNLLKKVGGY